MIATQRFKKWGNSMGVRIPKEVAKKAHISVDQQVDIKVSGETIILSPLKKDYKSIDDLLRGVTPSMINGEYEWGGDVGAEKW